MLPNTETLMFWLELAPVEIAMVFTPIIPENWRPFCMTSEESADPFSPDTVTELFATLDSRVESVTLWK